MRNRKKKYKSELFEQLYKKYKYLMMKIAFEILNDSYLSEDAVQNAFAKIASNLDKIKDVDSQRTKHFITTITRNSAIDIYRRRRVMYDAEMSVEEIEKADRAVYDDPGGIRQEIKEAFSRLPEIYKEALVLKYSCGLEYHEIAKALNLHEGTVRQRVSRAKQFLQELISGGETNER